MPAARPRLAELVIALSLATDIGSGMPMEMMLASCLVSVRLGKALGLNDDELREAYYLALLRHAGCTAEAPLMAELMSDDFLSRTPAYYSINPRQPLQTMNIIWRSIIDQQQPALARFGLFMRFMAELPQIITAHCEVAQQLAARLNVDETIQIGLRQMGERWDGAGFPNKLKGEAIRLPVRVAQVAHDAVIIHHFFGVEAAMAAMKDRGGATLDPTIAEAFGARSNSLLAMPSSLRDEVLACEPGPRPTLNDEHMEAATMALADFAELQTPFSTGHSVAVAALAEAAARQCRLPDSDVTLIRRAGHLHDLGRVGVSAGIWGRAGALSEADWERVRLHPYYAQRILAQPSALAELGAVASAHHERLDGSGYHRRLPATMLPPTARLLAAADAYGAMTEARPHRPALAPEAAAVALRHEAKMGRLASDAVDAVLRVADHPVKGSSRAKLTAELSPRELEVLRLIARGHSNKQMAQTLVVSDKTVGRHVERLYNKIGVSTRAGATLFAVQNGLLEDIAL
jgi:HD-GYP domain-containing protein (c-di-GMP phosphodiesterase class II)